MQYPDFRTGVFDAEKFGFYEYGYWDAVNNILYRGFFELYDKEQYRIVSHRQLEEVFGWRVESTVIGASHLLISEGRQGIGELSVTVDGTLWQIAEVQSYCCPNNTTTYRAYPIQRRPIDRFDCSRATVLGPAF